MGHSKRGSMRLQIILFLLFFALSVFAFNEENCKVTQEKICIDYSEKIIDGLPTSQCWKYQEKHICSSKEQNNCAVFEVNRGCHETGGKCKEETPLGNCKEFEKKFTCGTK